MYSGFRNSTLNLTPWISCIPLLLTQSIQSAESWVTSSTNRTSVWSPHLSMLHSWPVRCKLVHSACKLVDSACKLVDSGQHKACTDTSGAYLKAVPLFAHCWMLSQLGSRDWNWGWHWDWVWDWDWDWDWKVLPRTSEKAGRIGWLQHMLSIMRWAFAVWIDLLRPDALSNNNNN